MDAETIDQRIAEVEAQFTQLDQQKNQIVEEQYRLQGEFRILKALKEKSENDSKETKPSKGKSKKSSKKG